MLDPVHIILLFYASITLGILLLQKRRRWNCFKKKGTMIRALIDRRTLIWRRNERSKKKKNPAPLRGKKNSNSASNSSTIGNDGSCTEPIKRRIWATSLLDEECVRKEWERAPLPHTHRRSRLNVMVYKNAVDFFFLLQRRRHKLPPCGSSRTRTHTVLQYKYIEIDRRLALRCAKKVRKSKDERRWDGGSYSTSLTGW